MKTAVTELNRTLEESFVDSKLRRSEKKECGDWKRLDGKELWDRIDWSGNLSGTKTHEKPEDEETFKYFKNLYAPENEPVVDDIIVGQQIYIPVTDDPVSTSEVSEAFNQIFTLRTITESAKMHNTPIFISHIDLEKAFDRVRRATMLKVLIRSGMGTRMVYAIKSLYSSTNVFVNKIGTFRSTCGIRQGSSSSVLYFHCVYKRCISTSSKYLRR